MISLNQIRLLEQKIESAVEKIRRLQAENDALRKSCEELTNALSVKSEQLSKFEQEQSQIESGIKNALERLTAIENSVIEAASQQPQNMQPSAATVEQNASSDQSFEHTDAPPAPQNAISQNNALSAPQNSVPQNTAPSVSQNTIAQNSTPSIPQNSVPQNTAVPQEHLTSYTSEGISQEPQNTSQQNDAKQAEQQELLAQSNEMDEGESSVEENGLYDQEIENSFDDGLLFSPASEDTEIDDFYDEQESSEDNSSNNEQDSSNIDIY